MSKVPLIMRRLFWFDRNLYRSEALSIGLITKVKGLKDFSGANDTEMRNVLDTEGPCITGGLNVLRYLWKGVLSS